MYKLINETGRIDKVHDCTQDPFIVNTQFMVVMLFILIESYCLTKSTNILIIKRVSGTNLD